MDSADGAEVEHQPADASWIDELEARPPREAPAVPEVRLIDFPVELGRRQRQRTTELMREFQLIELDSQANPPTPGDTPRRLLDFATEIYEEFGPALEGPREELEAAIDAGRSVIEQRYPLRADSAALMLRFARLMEDADEFCREGLLISLQPDPEIYALRRWTVEEFVRQYHGEAPRPWRD